MLFGIVHQLVPPTANAQTAQTAQTTTTTTTDELPEEVVTPDEALAWSLGTTLGGIALGIGIGVSGNAFGASTMGDVLRGTGTVVSVLALTAGPSVGAMKAGAWSNGIWHSVWRLALGGGGAGLFMLGLVVALVAGASEPDLSVGGPLMILGAGAILAVPVWAVIDIVKSPGVARDQMREKGMDMTALSVGVAPIILRDGGGMALSLTF